MTEKNPEPGDIIFVNRGLYKHYGVYVGNNRVVHFAAKKKTKQMQKMPTFRKQIYLILPGMMCWK